MSGSAESLSTKDDAKAETSTANASVGDATDILSENFDPLLALYTEEDNSVNYEFNSLKECEAFFKQKEKNRQKMETRAKEEARANSESVAAPSLKPGEGRMAPLGALPERTLSRVLKDSSSSGFVPGKPRRPERNVMTRMKEHQEGPLSLLRRAVEDGHRVRVWTRSHVYVRGICSGFLVAYDKHWNLAMADVDEEFLIPKCTRDKERERERKRRRRKKEWTEKEEKSGDEEGETEDHTSKLPSWQPSSEKRLNRFTARRTIELGKVQKRHVGQLFIKGDNVVMVGLAR